MKRLLLPLLAALALTIAVNAETSDINAGFIDLADSPAQDISEEESEEDTETTSKNTED
ncbi:hypothetical protein [Prochlorococcus marinus]|uniref:Secreted protein n=1 Tax=Prochlorococcus marinus str. SB TaxID=59926 RepID=A0A0A2B199_PROMR|nr:hypothetical protein [Prochlorococcus marinus]KGG07868.1 hypothetical protein EV02_0535 [Prochlorococcus marinus str. SB]